MRHITILLLLISATSSAQDYKQETFSTSVKKYEHGAKVVFRNKFNSFSIYVNASKIESKYNKIILADDNILQYVLVPFPHQLNYNQLNEIKKKEYLLDYKQYEMEYLKKQLDNENLDERYKFQYLNNQLFLFWSYKMPRFSKTVKQFYLVTVCFNNILVLNAPVDNENLSLKVEHFLLHTGQSLSLNDKTLIRH